MQGDATGTTAPARRLSSGGGNIGSEQKKKTINPAGGGLARTVKASYFKMGRRNFLFTKADGFSATCVMIEYAKEEREA